jgi:ABC-type multidrug transport system, permease component
MKQLLIFIKKEFYHILRDPKSMLVLLGMPIVQIVLFGFAITNEIQNASIAILDNSKDDATQNLITRIESSRYFNIDRSLHTNDQIYNAFKTGRIKMAVIFQPDFKSELAQANRAQIQLIADASDPNNANTLINYTTSIIMDYQNEMNQPNKVPYNIQTEMKMLYNPGLKGIYSSVPGVMALILMLISAMMTSIAIVKEKEIGTMEVLLVSPVKSSLVVISKTIPYFILSFINVATILLLSVYVLGMPIEGSVILLFAMSILYIFCSLSLGLFISTSVETQQAAMLVSLMGLMLPVMMLSGYMFPIANMPWILQILSNIVPAKWYIIIVKQVMIKGLGFTDIWDETLVLLGMTFIFILLSIKRFKTRLK